MDMFYNANNKMKRCTFWITLLIAKNEAHERWFIVLVILIRQNK